MSQPRARQPATSAPAPAPAFDAHHAPDPELIADCVHCGFCLPSCPTYVLWGEEMDSPRGRIALMKLANEREIGLDASFTRHMDQCLGCMACMTACPSGVQYDQLIEATRAQIERNVERPRADRAFRALLFALFPHPGRLRALAPLLWAYQRVGLGRLAATPLARRVLPARLLGMERVMPPVRLGALGARVADHTPAHGTRRLRVGLLTGCVQRVFFGAVNAATLRVLAAEGCEVVAPRTQGCCGALHIHGGREAEGLALARRLIDTFAAWGVDRIVVNAAGCGSNLKAYGQLLRDDPVYAERAAAFAASVRDVMELLAELEPRATRHPLALRVAYHDACHLGHAQGIRRQPREVLRTIPALDLTDIAESDLCCGSAGIFNLVEPETAATLGERKARNAIATGAACIATGNPGCLLQIQAALHNAGEPLPALHPVELLDAAIRGVSVRHLLAGR
ncbi:MAG TPA: heterodisulfide reductase-related iron-sulfur binding cluster [Ktedonobacterales bacterium]|nr:heterodisulfide reductase-related iron-sulfur binding cluster [Ktedonobacterales bacterium]